jgi:hypothetical protein
VIRIEADSLDELRAWFAEAPPTHRLADATVRNQLEMIREHVATLDVLSPTNDALPTVLVPGGTVRVGEWLLVLRALVAKP